MGEREEGEVMICPYDGNDCILDWRRLSDGYWWHCPACGNRWKVGAVGAMTDHDETTEIRGAARVLGLLYDPDPLNAAVDRLSSPDVTTGATPCPPALADALADLLLKCEAITRETGTDWHMGDAQRVARAVLGWL